MKCPECQSSTRVIDSRKTDSTTKRIRECWVCKARFTTYEIVVKTKRHYRADIKKNIKAITENMKLAEKVAWENYTKTVKEFI